MNTHSFSTQLATLLGLKDAIILQHFYFWHQSNKGKEDRCFDGLVWSYNTIKSISEIFPYLTEKEVRGAIERLISGGYIVEGNYNKFSYDRTKWYALTDTGVSIFEAQKMPITKGQMDTNKRANPFDKKANGNDKKSNEKLQNVTPIPYSNYKNNPYSNKEKEFSREQDFLILGNENEPETISLIKKEKETAEGARENSELAVLSSQIGVSYVSTQKRKENALEVPKKQNKGKRSIQEDENFQSYESFLEKWEKTAVEEFPNIDPKKCFLWFCDSIESKYNGMYFNYFSTLSNWLRSNEAKGANQHLKYTTTMPKNAQTTQKMLEDFGANGRRTTGDMIDDFFNEVRK